MKICILLLPYLLLTGHIYAQTDINNATQDDYINMKLPPIEEVVQAAIDKAAFRKYHQAREEEANLKIKSVKREWQKSISFQANYRFGKVGLLSNQESSTVQANDFYSSNVEHWFSAGAYIDLPLLEITDRKNRIRQQQLVAEQSKHEANREAETVSKEIITLYNNVLLQLAILKIKAESLDLNNAQIRISEKDFIKGKIDLAEFSRLKELQVSAKIGYETVRAQTNTAIMQLEYLTGLHLIKTH